VNLRTKRTHFKTFFGSKLDTNLMGWEKSGKGKKKGKAIPLQAWAGPEGSRRLRLQDSKTIGT
jgi:hypothetical protein